MTVLLSNGVHIASEEMFLTLQKVGSYKIRYYSD